ncbi:MAG: hypothetical protein HC852_23825, partial [Acaryochloridaceae cyanobacterium RU_4_10]|nr:hypothetical protein [Acaryochloridaceae cyanobacterium RU_4_10]
CFEQAIVQVKGTRHDRWAEKASVCLALTRSYLGQKEVAHQQADAIHRTIVQDRQGESRGSFAYFIQLLGQTYVNLGLFETAQLLFEKALSFSEASHYTQVKAKTLTSLAIIQRQKTDLRMRSRSPRCDRTAGKNWGYVRSGGGLLSVGYDLSGNGEGEGE